MKLIGSACLALAIAMTATPSYASGMGLFNFGHFKESPKHPKKYGPTAPCGYSSCDHKSPQPVPEISSAGIGTAVALLAGALVIAGERRKKS